jgi:LPS sulfotransferase NodH
VASVFNDAGVTPFKVVYEDFIATYEGTVDAILDYLGITVPANHIFAPRKLKKMSDATMRAGCSGSTR